ncbi:methyl-accepting chemotaxis protein [Herbaspirillum sp. alder98]|uniref:methyl-accepting chemotaxis protein n=1 Tax=Herbaspirillum sp. alder98 TaxID=2913096 RepID=UPI001CD8FAD8|nr:methyl-accepting chemotaxis protein [Herbaspirillum sp. alder98]MCA1326641.1 methyl-accepting chemotaxis protein [Herbaspirillum sp. alder98]
MKWFYDLKISRKLITAFLVVVMMVAALGAFAVRQLDKVNSASTEIATNWLPSIRTLSVIQLTLSRVRSFEMQHILASDPKEFAEIEQSSQKQIDLLKKQLALYDGQISEPEEKALYPEVQKLIASFLAEHEKIIALSKQDKNDEARTLQRGEATRAYRALLQNLEKLINVNDTGADGSNALADAIYAQSRLWIIVLVLSCVALSMLLAMWVSRLIARPIEEAVAVAQRVAGGDLTANIQSTSKDEAGQLLDALKTMNGSLLTIVAEVRQGTSTITTASTEIAAGNLDLSSRTEQQASSLEETASAMEELTSTVKQNADNAKQANQLAVSASEVASAGGDVVGKVVDTMGSINESSRKIADIISVIDGIAFQTNILALNAAVEAARAGEQGRGFAVVASEVRSLAQRSAAAAKEIKGLIEGSVAQVDLGSKLVEEAGSTMTEVVNSVRRVTDIVAEITSASQEQSEGIEQINLAITQMDEVTQQNAALVEQAAAAAQSLQEQAEKLTDTVSVFKLDSNAVATPPKSTFSAAAAPKGNTFAPRNTPPRKRTQDVTPPKPALKASAPAASKLAPASDDSGSWETF